MFLRPVVSSSPKVSAPEVVLRQKVRGRRALGPGQPVGPVWVQPRQGAAELDSSLNEIATITVPARLVYS